jgi:vitamin B12 transporter
MTDSETGGRARGRYGAAALALYLAACAQQSAATQSILEEVVISASRVPLPLREVGTSVSVLPREEIERRGFLSLPELLRTQPSVAASNNGGIGKATSLRIRGEEGYRTLVLLDGIDISDTSSPQVSPRLEQLLSAGIERVEILRGPQGLGYGADAGGVINIRSRAPSAGLGGELSAQTGTYGTQQLGLSIGGRSERVEALLTAAQLETDGFNARTTDTAPADRDGYDNRTVHGRLGWRAAERLKLELVARSVEGENDFDSCFRADFSATDHCSDRFEQASWRAAASLEGDDSSHQLAVSESGTTREFFADGAQFYAAEGMLRRLSYVGSWRGGEVLALIAGADAERESIDDGSFDRARDQFGAYAELQGQFDRGLTIAAGLRFDDNEDFGSFTSYRLSASKVIGLPGSELKLKTSIGTGFRAPSLYEISYNGGPFALPPAASESLAEEQSSGYDLGATWALTSGSYLEITWFDQEVDNLITFDLVGFSGYLQTPGESRSRGVELAGRYALPGGFTVGGNYTWNDTESVDGSQRPFRPRQLANLTLSHTALDNRLRSGIGLRASRDAVDTAGAALDDYLLLDISVRYRMTAGLELFARLENALDEAFVEVPTYNSAGRTAFTGLRYAF